MKAISGIGLLFFLCVEGPSKTLAETVLRKRQVEVAEGRHLGIKKQNKVKFDDLCIIYLELHSKSKKSYRTDVTRVKQLNSVFGGKYLYDINTMSIERYRIDRAKEVAQATVNRELAVLKNMFNKVIEWHKADHNPALKVKLFKENNQRVRYLEKEEIEKLLRNSRAY